MRKRLVVALFTGVLLSGECISRPETRRSRVHVFATDLTGAPISDVEIELTPLGASSEAIKTSGQEARVLYGNYQLRAHATGFAFARRELRIYQPEVFVRVELAVGSIGCPMPPAEIGGRIRRSDTTKELWVKATPVRGVGGGEARVVDGRFLMSGLDYSSYIVMVIEGDRILHQQIVKSYPEGNGTKLDIDLSKGK